MFRRQWAGLPKDHHYPSTLCGLGFFINDVNEIRSIENPDCYYQYASNRNERINMRRGFHFDLAVQEAVYDRLELAGMRKVLLPPGAKPSEPHVSVFMTAEYAASAPTILILGEPTQAQGILSSRVTHGPGGIEEGSAISLVRALDAAVPGARIVVANMGALWWWPGGERTITVRQAGGLPSRSLVSRGVKYTKSVNEVKGHEDGQAHLVSVLRDVVGSESHRLFVLGFGTAGDTVIKFLDEKENWEAWGRQVEGMVVTGMPMDVNGLKNPELKALLAKRTRRYILSSEPLDTPLCTATGDPALFFEEPGMPCYSSSHDWSVEMIAVKARDSIASYVKEIATVPDPRAFENLKITVEGKQKPRESENEMQRGTPPDIPEGEKPLVKTLDPELLDRQREWLEFEEKGKLVDAEALAEAMDGLGEEEKKESHVVGSDIPI